MKVVVTSPSFSKNKKLQSEINKYFLNPILNSDGIKFHQSELIEYIKEADAVIVGLESISEDVLNKCPDL